MGCICRPTRSISTHTHPPRPPPVAQVQDQRPGVCIPLSVPRVFTRVVKDSRSILAPQQGINKPISRRLDYFCPISIKNPESDLIRYGFSFRSRVHCKQNKCQLNPTQSPAFPGAQLDLQKGRVTPIAMRVAIIRLCISILKGFKSASAIVWLKVMGLMASLVDLVP